MRLLYVVQRYGTDVAGGAETHCRHFATRLAARGHHVEVLTSCAVSHSRWANVYPEGDSEIDGVVVHRLAVVESPTDGFLARVSERVVWGARPTPIHLQERWMELQGPLIRGMGPWLEKGAGHYDVVIFFTYLFYPTWAGLPVAARCVPTVLHPTAHDEPALGVRLYDTTFRHPAAFAFSTEEEAELVVRRFRVRQPHAIVGIGVDLDTTVPSGAVEAFRAAHGLEDRPYVVYVGRVEEGKGAQELFAFFDAYKRRNPGPLALVMVGSVVDEPEVHPDVVMTGFVDDEVRTAALAGSVALIQPSYFESFSMVLTEAWALRVPALVQGHCDVLDGQVRRSGGGLPYRGFAEFEAAVDLVTSDPEVRRSLGEAGRRYTEAHYRWDVVLDRYEQLLSGLLPGST